MLRFNRVVCVLAVGLLVTVAFAKAIKIKEITPVAGTEEALNGADGMAIFNYHDGENNNSSTEVTVAITDFMPGKTYGAYVIPGGGVDLPEVANPAGNANFHGVFTFDLCIWNEVGLTVVIWRDLDENGVYTPGVDEDVAEGWTACP